MTVPPSDDETLDPAAHSVLRRVRLMMLISGLTTLIAIGAVLTVIGYRLFRSEGSVVAADVTAVLPKGARILSTTVAGDRIVVTLEVAGVIEVRSFDLHSLQPVGRLRFVHEP
jgi:hypothetical protein